MIQIFTKKTARFILLSGLTLLLSACANKLSVQQKSAWDIHRSALTALDHWTLNGRIAVKDEAQGWNASVRWTQQGSTYRIDLIGPFGQGRVIIDGNHSGVLVHTNEGVLSAPDPESLLEQATGIRVPISGLRYWVLGLPVPDQPATPATNRAGQLDRLRQSGWSINYPRYTETDVGVTLPKLMRANQYDIKVKLVVDSWSLPG